MKEIPKWHIYRVIQLSWSKNVSEIDPSNLKPQQQHKKQDLPQ